MRTSKTKQAKPGLYANIHAKQERIAHGSGEKMRKPGEEGAPTAEAFDKAAKSESGSRAGEPHKSPSKTSAGRKKRG